jgi:hypothetical protein
MASQSDWLLLNKEADRRLDTGTIDAAHNMINRGQVPVTAIRSDIPGSTTPERVEGLLAKAARTALSSWGDEITAHYSGEQDRRSILGPRSNLESVYGGLAWSYGYRAPDWTIRFRSVRVHWSALVEALEEGGFRLRKRRPGPKDGEQSVKDLACEIALQVLDDEAQRPNPGYGRRVRLAGIVNAKLAKLGHQYKDDSARKMIGPTLREWETKHPGR